MVQLYVNVQFQVKPLSTGTSSSRTKKKFPKNSLMDHPKVCIKFGVCSTRLSLKSAGVAAPVAAGHDKRRGSNVISNSSRTHYELFIQDVTI